MIVIFFGWPLVRFMSGRRCTSSSRAAEEDEVVTVLGLGEEQPVLTARLPTFAINEEVRKRGEPLESALEYITSRGGRRSCTAGNRSVCWRMRFASQ
jgi:hypothetical protein